MPELSDRDRGRLSELQAQLENEDPPWARQLSHFGAGPSGSGTTTVLTCTLIATVVLTALSALLGDPAAPIFGVLSLIVVFIRRYL